MDGAWWSGSFLLPFSAPRSRRDRHALARPPRAKPLLPPIDAPVCHCLAAFAFTGFRDATRRGAAAAKPQEITRGGGGGIKHAGGGKGGFSVAYRARVRAGAFVCFPAGGWIVQWRRGRARRARGSWSCLVLFRLVSSRRAAFGLACLA